MPEPVYLDGDIQKIDHVAKLDDAGVPGIGDQKLVARLDIAGLENFRNGDDLATLVNVGGGKI